MTFTVDTHVPSVSIDAVSSPTKDSTPTLTGVAGAAEGDGPVVLTIYVGGVVGGSVAEAVSVGRSGSSWSHTTGALVDGTYTARATQETSTGATGVSSAVTFTVDTVAPVVSIDQVVSPPTDATPTFTGRAGTLPGDDPHVTVTITAGEAQFGSPSSIPVVSGKWTYTPSSPLPDNAYTISVAQEDGAGNTGTAGPRAFVVDTNAPDVSFDPVATPTNDPTPTLSGGGGVRGLDEKTVVVTIYAGDAVTGPPVVKSQPISIVEARWSYTPTPLADGMYTAVVTQRNVAHEERQSVRVFQVDTVAPLVTVAQPSDGAILTSAQPTFSGLAGTALGDQPSVTLNVYAGAAAAGPPVETLKLAPAGSGWSSGASVSPLPNGIYTAVADQVDEAGNDGRSISTFAISVPAPTAITPTAPAASFRWFPTTPRVGEPVSLVSTSSAGSSPITGFAWSVDGGSSLTPGPAVLATSFASPGPQLVRLQVTDANGLSAVIGETITVAKAAAVLMQPFPVVRIAGSGNGRGIKISLFTVLAPTGARVTVSCHGRGCPSAPQSIVARAGRHRRRAATVLISFARFERSLRVGAVLEIRVSRQGQIGKYTRFTVRRGKLPARLDTCLSPGGVKPMSCPS
jgi:hypothetical protein